jgi:DNA-binding transcriptional ArsR family regulator
LDILCCLSGDPLAVEQVSGKTGMAQTRAKHHMRILDAFGLIGKMREGESGRMLYVARLDGQPEWVREAVERHKRVAKK